MLWRERHCLLAADGTSQERDRELLSRPNAMQGRERLPWWCRSPSSAIERSPRAQAGMEGKVTEACSLHSPPAVAVPRSGALSGSGRHEGFTPLQAHFAERTEDHSAGRRAGNCTPLIVECSSVPQPAIAIIDSLLAQLPLARQPPSVPVSLPVRTSALLPFSFRHALVARTGHSSARHTGPGWPFAASRPR